MSEIARSAKRRAAFRLGLSAEGKAAMLLAAKGYRTIARRWKSPVGEIDLVVKRGQRIVAAAEAWLAAHPEHAGYDMRFEAVLVLPGRMPQHVVSAFEAD